MGVLKVKVDGQWQEAYVPPAPPPDEVIISSIPPRDVSTELWFDPDAVMPSMTDEVYIGPDEPVMFPEVEMWFDTDAPDPPPAEMPDFALRADTMLKAQVHAHHIAGPITTGAVEVTLTLAAGTYLCQFQMSAVGTATGIRYINLDMESPPGTWANVGQSKHWFNAVNIHYVMSNGVSVITIPADGDYPFRLSLSASLSADVNDFGMIVLLPCEPGCGLMVGQLKVKDAATGGWINIATTGPIGPPGLPAIIIGDFGASRVPLKLPVDGVIPVDWDEVGDPAHQMKLAEALIYNPTDPTVAQAGHLFSFTDPGWIDSGRVQGIVGPQGETGVSTVIIGDFGATTTPADLPPDGLIPIDWDGPGEPAVAYQMELGYSLYYDKPADPLDGHLFQYVGTSVDAAGWLDVGLIQGPQGIPGPEGPVGPPSDDIWVDPSPPILPETELWFDTDDDRLLGPYNLPDGGLTYDGLVKTTDLDGDIGWRNIYSVPSGKVIQFPNEADKAKIQLYGSTFGFGITGSTLNIFSSNHVKFNQSSITGTQNANIHNAGMDLNSGHLYFPGDGHGVRFNGNGYIYKKSGGGIVIRKHSANSQIKIENNDGGGGLDIAVVSGPNAGYMHLTGGNRIYQDATTDTPPHQWIIGETRKLNSNWLNRFYTNWTSTHSNGPETEYKIEIEAGGYGTRTFTFQTSGNLELPGSPVVADVAVRGTAPTRTNEVDLDVGAAGRLIDALHPIAFDRVDTVREGATTDLPPVRRQVGLTVEAIQASGEIDGLVEDQSYSLSGLLAVAISEIKSLRERVAQLEGGA